MTSQCLFCRIIDGEIPSQKVYGDDDVYAFQDINPAAPTHILVIPRKHLASVDDANPEDEALMGKLVLAAQKIAREQQLHKDGFRLVIGVVGQQDQPIMIQVAFKHLVTGVTGGSFQPLTRGFNLHRFSYQRDAPFTTDLLAMLLPGVSVWR